MREVLYIDKITYEDCGVLGGRSYIKSGTEIELLESTTPNQLLKNVMFDQLERNERGKNVYPFNRIGICGILLNGKILIAATTKIIYREDKYADCFQYLTIMS